MTDQSKKNFLIITIIGSFVIYSMIYYTHVLKVAPYNFKEFKSFVFKYGSRDNMVNYYNSVTGEYDYLNKQDSLVKTHLQLNRADLDSLHVNASKLGFWDFPDDETNNDSVNHTNNNKVDINKIPRYYIEFNYTRKSKRATFDENFDGPTKLIDANKGMITKIRDILSNAEERQAK